MAGRLDVVHGTPADERGHRRPGFPGPAGQEPQRRDRGQRQREQHRDPARRTRQSTPRHELRGRMPPGADRIVAALPRNFVDRHDERRHHQGQRQRQCERSHHRRVQAGDKPSTAGVARRPHAAAVFAEQRARARPTTTAAGNPKSCRATSNPRAIAGDHPRRYRAPAARIGGIETHASRRPRSGSRSAHRASPPAGSRSRRGSATPRARGRRQIPAQTTIRKVLRFVNGFQHVPRPRRRPVIRTADGCESSAERHRRKGNP